MLKKMVVMMLAVQGLGVYADPAIENFDWGSGIPGREMFTAGSPVDGVLARFGDVVFRDTGKDKSVFSGASGSGRGVLRMKGAQNAVGFVYPVSGITVIKAEGRFYPGVGEKGLRGFWIGIQSAAPDKSLLNNQTTDHLVVQLNPEGAVTLRSVVGGVTNAADAGEGRIQFSPGDPVKLELTVNADGKTASIKTTGTGENNMKVRTLKWTSGKVPDFGMIMINQTGSGELLLDSVEVRTEQPPRIVG
ncbi:MAG: hypothetical protein WC334_00800 [Kiritimatiellales bacterium]|jgi:hypothetical protein